MSAGYSLARRWADGGPICESSTGEAMGRRDGTLAARIEAVRAFNRFYTREIGALRRHVLDSPFSLAEARVLYEIAHRDAPTASDIAKALDLDPGYLSRMLKSFARQGLLVRTASDKDARQSHLALTEQGRATVAPLEERQRQAVGAMLARLPEAEQARLVAAMQTIASLLDAKRAERPPYVLREHRPGDMGYVVASHGAYYAQAHGFDMTFEALVAEIVAQFIKTFDARHERCWIAEIDGEPVGSVFLVRASEEEAKLRLLLVEPRAQGLGLGKRLVAECVRFARAAGYRRITLWTQSVLERARRLYAEAGFKLVHAKPHRSFGQDLVGETWEMAL